MQLTSCRLPRARDVISVVFRGELQCAEQQLSWNVAELPEVRITREYNIPEFHSQRLCRSLLQRAAAHRGLGHLRTIECRSFHPSSDSKSKESALFGVILETLDAVVTGSNSCELSDRLRSYVHSVLGNQPHFRVAHHCFHPARASQYRAVEIRVRARCLLRTL